MYRFIKNPDPRKKPPFGSIIDPHHSMSQGLLGGWLFNEEAGRIVHNVWPKNNSFAQRRTLSTYQTIHGQGLHIDSTGNGVQLSDIILPKDGIYTIIMDAEYYDQTVDQGFIGGSGIDSWQVWKDEYVSGDRWGLGIYTTSYQVSYGAATSPSKRYSLALRYNDGGACKLYVDGALEATVNYLQSVDIHLAVGCANGQDSKVLDGLIYHTHIYDRILSLEEIIQHKEEPYANIMIPKYWFMADFGAAAGLSKVNSDLTSIYDSFSSVQSNLQIAFDISNIVQSDVGAVFDLLNTVNSDLSLLYDMDGRIASDLKAVYDQSEKINADLTSLFDIQNKVQGDLTPVFDILNIVNSDRAIVYDVLELVQSDLELNFDIFERIPSDLEMVYDLFGTAPLQPPAMGLLKLILMRRNYARKNNPI